MLFTNILRGKKKLINSDKKPIKTNPKRAFSSKLIKSTLSKNNFFNKKPLIDKTRQAREIWKKIKRCWNTNTMIYKL